jgi:DNA-binding transcriptional LysR family regulator
VAAKSSSVKAILALVAAGRGVCLLPEAVARQYPREDVAYVRVSDAEPAVVSLAWAPGSADPEVALLLETARRVAAGVEGTLVEGDAV